MAGKLLLFAFLVVLQSDGIDIHIFRLAFLCIYRLYFLLEVKKGFIVLPKTVIHIACDSMSVSRITSAVIIFSFLFVLIYIVKRLLGWFWPSLLTAILFIILKSQSAFSSQLLQTFSRLAKSSFCKLWICNPFFLSIGIDIFFQNGLLVVFIEIYLSNCFHLGQLSIIQILSQLSLYSLPPILDVQLCAFAKIKSRCKCLICLWFVVQSMRLYVMCLHEIAITDSSTIFDIPASVCLGTRSLIKFAKSWVWKSPGVWHLLLYVLFNWLSFQFFQLSFWFFIAFIFVGSVAVVQ